MCSSENSSRPASIGSLLWVLPPVLLVIVATIQPVFVKIKNFDRWEGGGFGMFASVDRESLRSRRLFVQTDEGEFPAFFIDWKVDRKRAATLPNTTMLQEEIDSMVNTAWCLCELNGITKRFEEVNDISFGHAQLFEAISSAKRAGPPSFSQHGTFLIPHGKSDCQYGQVEVVDGLRLEIRRLVYHGDGRFGSALLNEVTGR